MAQKDIQNNIEKETKKFFGILFKDLNVLVEQKDKTTFSVSCQGEEPQIVIGKNGQTLYLIQHLFKKILRKKIGADFFIDLDINNYKKRKIAYLKELATMAADEVVLTKKEKILEPMTSYERRIVHLELAKRKDVSTESRGEEPYRRVVIKPI